MSPSVKLLKRDERSVTLLVEGVDYAFMNSLRRVLIAEIPVFAIDEVKVFYNNSVMYDEILAHRLAMVPLKTDYDTLPLEQCEEGGEFLPDYCTPRLYLHVEAPKDRTVVVYSGDLQGDFTEPVYKNIPIVKLAPGQVVELEAIARLGRGRDHAKWQAAHVAYKEAFEVHILDNAPPCEEALKQLKEFGLDQYFECSEGKLVPKDNIYEAKLSTLEYASRILPWLKVVTRKDAFIMYVESFGQVPVDKLLTLAFDVLEDKFIKFKEKLAHALGG